MDSELTLNFFPEWLQSNTISLNQHNFINFKSFCIILAIMHNSFKCFVTPAYLSQTVPVVTCWQIFQLLCELVTVCLWELCWVR